MRLDVITIFPGYLEPLRHALLGKAIEQGRLEVAVHNLRAWATGNHKAVDDSPFGGGPGMVMKPEVWGPALDDVVAGSGVAAETPLLTSAQLHLNKPRHDELRDAGARTQPRQAASISAGAEGTPIAAEEMTGEPGHGARSAGKTPLIIVPTPAGEPFTQRHAEQWAKEEHLIFACGRYEGIDQRVVDEASENYRVQEVSIGDYVLVGGEVAVLVIAEAVVRLIPGVLGNATSHEDDSFSTGLLEGPSYTKPRVWRGREVPEVLLSGNHAKIAQWRRKEALTRTAQRRPELLADVELSDAERRWVEDFI